MLTAEACPFDEHLPAGRSRCRPPCNKALRNGPLLLHRVVRGVAMAAFVAGQLALSDRLQHVLRNPLVVRVRAAEPLHQVLRQKGGSYGHCEGFVPIWWRYVSGISSLIISATKLSVALNCRSMELQNK